MYRFLVEDIKFDNLIYLDNKDLYFQLTKVLRIKLEDEIILFNSKIKKDFFYRIIEIKKDKIVLSLKEIVNKNLEKDINLVLYQALPNKITKIEYILQKAVEVGFNKIIFFKADRSQKLNISNNKLKRFNKIVLEATEQSNRNSLLKFKIIDSIFEEDLQKSENIIFHQINTKDAIKIKDLKVKKDKKIAIFIWPEWGFSDMELEKFKKISKYKIYLWNNILRTETAGIVTWFFLLQNL